MASACVDSARACLDGGSRCSGQEKRRRRVDRVAGSRGRVAGGVDLDAAVMWSRRA